MRHCILWLQQNLKIDFYCEDHADVICSPCKNLKHHTCQTISIQQKSSGCTSSKMDAVITRAKALRDKYDQLKQECNTNLEELGRFMEACRKEIKEFRKTLNERLDKLEKDVLEELDQLGGKELQRTESQLALLTTALQMLDKDDQLLNEAINDGRKETLFIVILRSFKELYDYEKRLIDIGNDVGHVSLSFKRNTQLDQLQKDIKTFGSLTMVHNMPRQREETMFLGRHIQSHRDVNVRLDDDKKDPWISGCAVMPNNSVVICDHNNNKIKLLDSSLAFTQSLKLSAPWDVAVSDANKVTVTLPGQRKLQFIKLFPRMKSGRVIQLDRWCWGVHVSSDAMYVTCHESGEGEVRVFDKQGNIRRRFGTSLQHPYYITVNSHGNKVFISDEGSHTVTCFALDSSVIYQYQNNKGLLGIYCDDEDFVLVCGRVSNNVQMITANGKESGTLLSAADGLKQPYSIVHRKCDNTLIVGCLKSDNILVYHLT